MDREPDPCLFPALGVVSGETKMEWVKLDIETEMLSDILQFCKENEITIYSFFKAVWSIFLHQFTQTDHVYFGINMGAFTEGTIHGYLKNRMVANEALITQDTNIKELFGRISPVKEGEYGKFNTGLFFQHGPWEENEGDIFMKDLMAMEGGEYQDYVLLLGVNDCDGRPQLTLHYNMPATLKATSFTGTILQILRIIVKNPEARIKEIEFVHPEHKADLLRWSYRTAGPGRPAIVDTDGQKWLEHWSTLTGSSLESGISYKGDINHDENILPTNKPSPDASDIQFKQVTLKDHSIVYWKKYLTNIEPCIIPQLNEDFSKTKNEKEWRCHHQSLNSGPQISRWCQEKDINQFSLFRLAWGLVLRAYTNLDQICFGYSTNDRGTSLDGINDRIEDNAMVCRMRLPDNTELLQFLRQSHNEHTEALSHRYIPLGEILQAVQPAVQPLFNTILSISLSASGTCSTESGIHFTNVEVVGPIEYDIGLNLAIQPNGTDIHLSYSPNSTSTRQAVRIAETFDQTISEIISKENCLLGELEVMSAHDKAKIGEWNEKEPEGVTCLVHEDIHELSLIQPDALAVCAWDGEFSYRELDDLSTRLAAHLVAFGIRQEVFVPILFEKSCWTAISMLGVLKAGAAFVLLDIDHPQQRLKHICQNIAAKVILCSKQSSSQASELVPNVIPVHHGSDSLQEDLKQWTAPKVLPQNAIFGVFTSGSTGQPKCIVMEHIAFSTSAWAQGEPLKLNNKTRVFQFASYAFDVAIYDHLVTWLFGGCVCIPSEWDRKNDIAKAARQLGVNWADLTPTVARILSPAEIPTLETLCLAGEAMHQRDIETWASYVELINVYGPAECAISSVHPTRTGSQPGIVGRGTGSKCWVVSPNNPNQLLPLGAVGELLLEGHLVARGYLNNPHGTRAAFIESPSWLSRFRKSRSTTRFYLTGDLVQYTTDGLILYIGRKDGQVKIRGQRVEIGEIEKNLQLCFPGWNVVVGKVGKDTDDAPPLIFAFLETTQNQEKKEVSANNDTSQDMETSSANIFILPTEFLRSKVLEAELKLKAILPTYMIPNVYIQARIPLTATGKVNRRRLCELAGELSKVEIQVYSAFSQKKRMPSPEMDTERTIQRLWTQVLDIPLEQVGLDDNFLRSGGDSVSAMKLAAISRRHGLDISVGAIFKSATLLDLASEARKRTNSEAATIQQAPCSLLGITEHEMFMRNSITPAISIKDSNVIDVLPTTEFQRSHIRTGKCTYFLFDISGPVDKDRLEQAIHTITARHSILRTVFVPYKGGFVQAILSELNQPMKRHETEKNILDFSEQICREDSNLPVHFGAPFFHATLVSQREGHNTLIIKMSHAQYDGMSLPKLWDDLAAAYIGELTTPATSFSSYMQYRSSQQSKEIYNFWREFLQDSSMTYVQRTPISFKESNSDSALHKVIPLPTPPSGITLANLFKSAWAFVLANLTGRNDLVFGQTVSGRNIPVEGIDEIIGPCVNIIPTRVIIQSNWTVLDLLYHVRDQHMRTLPFETIDLVDIVTNSTSWPNPSKFGSIAMYQNIDLDPKITMGGMESTPRGLEFPDGAEEFYIVAMPSPEKLIVALSAPAEMLRSDAAEGILQQVCDTILSFAADPSKCLNMREEIFSQV